MADLVWHSLFGIEVGAEALLSPTHLALATGFTLMVAAPFRAWVGQPMIGSAATPRSAWPAITSLVLAAMMAMFITQFVHPYAEFWATDEPRRGLGLGIASVLIQSVIIAGAFVLLGGMSGRSPSGRWHFSRCCRPRGWRSWPTRGPSSRSPLGPQVRARRR